MAFPPEAHPFRRPATRWGLWHVKGRSFINACQAAYHVCHCPAHRCHYPACPGNPGLPILMDHPDKPGDDIKETRMIPREPYDDMVRSRLPGFCRT